jgi:DeoR/GlpR family transcriptional regulator of sugar metabolism
MTKTKILYDRETARELVETFRVSARTVRDALGYKSNSDLARRIRKRALDMGCKEKEIEVIKVIKYI